MMRWDRIVDNLHRHMDYENSKSSQRYVWTLRPIAKSLFFHGDVTQEIWLYQTAVVVVAAVAAVAVVVSGFVKRGRQI